LGKGDELSPTEGNAEFVESLPLKHRRAWPNFLAFGPTFLHFDPRAE